MRLLVPGFARNVMAVAWKEASLMRRSPVILGSVIAQPVIMLFLFGYVLSAKPANVPWGVLDHSRSPVSRRLVAEVQASGYFLERRDVASYEEGIASLLDRGILALVVLPPDLARRAEEGRAEAQVLLDGADPIAAARIGAYIKAIAAASDTGVALDRTVPAQRPVELRQRFWFNPTLADRTFLLASLAGMLLTNLCLSVASFGLVSEREDGTWEQTLALPVSVVELVLGKLAPNVALSYFVLALALLGQGLVFGVWPQGSVVALLVLTFPFVLATLGVGVMISTISASVAQAVFISVFAIMPSFVLSGVMMPYELMPTLPRWVGALAPLRWYQMGSRHLVSRGAGFADVLVPLAVMTAMFAGSLLLIRRWTRPRLD